jgi:hypothetical protein
MTMTPRLRKFTLTAHVIFSVGWLGAAAAYLALAIAALTSQDPQLIRATYLAMEPAAWFAIVPLALVALLSGLVMSLGTPWGLFRHWWVVFKLVLTVFAAVVLLEHMSTVSYLAGLAAEAGGAGPDPRGLRGEILHAGGGLLVLLVVTVLGVYKPRGMTPYGKRKSPNAALATGTGAPRWVKVFGIIMLVFVLLFFLAHLTGIGGSHGPGAH